MREENRWAKSVGKWNGKWRQKNERREQVGGVGRKMKWEIGSTEMRGENRWVESVEK